MTHDVHGCRWSRAQPGSILTGSETTGPESVSGFWRSHVGWGWEEEEGGGGVFINK